ncbi:hypothetical protein MetMK1DRAFT_00010220 [Metallosphaera yellowstonensis MK1]|uniref:Uncharacterized protein n=1 Tax=Metallosphaera yellowstonensis MK1 TaxID=671065 RepID=H2C2P8_9CREN|nr:hypothetical protein [Metallosphaera yellowstonensis]EHP70519.1 hypothetical protein MetMK1DRAFT_00010220 [Metallosphaera yellowstonensis MK1]
MRFEERLWRWRRFSEICYRYRSEALYDGPLFAALRFKEIEVELEEILNKFFVDKIEFHGERYPAVEGVFYFDDGARTEAYNGKDFDFIIFYADSEEYKKEKEDLVRGLSTDPATTEEAEIYAFLTTLLEFAVIKFLGRNTREPDCVERKCYLSLRE